MKRTRLIFVVGFFASRIHAFTTGGSSTRRHRQVYTSLHADPRQTPSDPNLFDTSLCVIPPQKAWDRLQRARHMARDPAYHTWPPAVRLFHPFFMDGSEEPAFDIASIIEELDLEPFEVTFDEWSIIPHLELMEAQWEFKQEGEIPSAIENDQEDEYDGGIMGWQKHEDQKIRSLITSVEEEGKRKKAARMAKQEKEVAEGKTTVQNSKTETATAAPKKLPTVKPKKRYKKKKKYDEATGKYIFQSPAETLAKQQRRFDEFDGPCIICLEPDAESKRKLCEMRNLIQDLLQLNEYTSPSSIYSWKYTELGSGVFRPLITISACSSVTVGMDIARRLKGLWEPLTFTVEDLHIISCTPPKETTSFQENWRDVFEYDLPSSFGQESVTLGPKLDTEVSVTSSAQIQSKMQVPWGCNARIMLMGREPDLSDNFDEETLDRLWKEGLHGGGDLTQDITVLEKEPDEVSEILARYLDDDEDDDEEDEGMSVTIGRTHFYTGDRRMYEGMPASSHVDAKDRRSGEDGNSSAAARRRGNVHRSAWDEGEYGRRKVDFSPFSKFDRGKRKRGGP